MLQAISSRTAIKDLNEQFEYFVERQSEKLAKRFLVAVSEALQHLMEFPEHGAKYRTREDQFQTVRCWTIRDFPKYVIFYRVDGHHLKVLRIVHGAKRVRKGFFDVN